MMKDSKSYQKFSVQIISHIIWVMMIPSVYQSCTPPEGLQDEQTLCESQESQGQYTYTSVNACGCSQEECEQGEACFQGACCNPLLELDNPDRCGCQEACTKGEMCIDGLCCNPSEAATNENCGCQGPCQEWEQCASNQEGTFFACECDPALNQDNPQACACGEACEAWEVCYEGQCQCDPSDPLNLSNDENCGCRGACPEGASCQNGQCSCTDEGQSLCDGICQADSVCLCEPSDHLNDVSNCACQGPCAEGELCQACEDESCLAQCQCDPLLHQSDQNNCGCEGSCPENLSCQGGQCVCPTSKLHDTEDCACAGPCAEGLVCSYGRCACPEENLFNSQNCACQGPCNSGEACEFGQCVACEPSRHLSDATNCACQGACASGERCQECDEGQDCYAECVCDPLEHLNDVQNCGCNGECEAGASCENGQCRACLPNEHLNDESNCGCAGSCGTGEICSNGTCQCDPLAHLNDSTNCGCQEVCGSGSTCQGGRCETCLPEEHLSDSTNCACTGPCSNGQICQACTDGTCLAECACNPLTNLNNSLNCGCAGACASNELCETGICVPNPSERGTLVLDTENSALQFIVNDDMSELQIIGDLPDSLNSVLSGDVLVDLNTRDFAIKVTDITINGNQAIVTGRKATFAETIPEGEHLFSLNANKEDTTASGSAPLQASVNVDGEFRFEAGASFSGGYDLEVHKPWYTLGLVPTKVMLHINAEFIARLHLVIDAVIRGEVNFDHDIRLYGAQLKGPFGLSLDAGVFLAIDAQFFAELALDYEYLREYRKTVNLSVGFDNGWSFPSLSSDFETLTQHTSLNQHDLSLSLGINPIYARLKFAVSFLQEEVLYASIGPHLSGSMNYTFGDPTLNLQYELCARGEFLADASSLCGPCSILQYDTTFLNACVGQNIDYCVRPLPDGSCDESVACECTEGECCDGCNFKNAGTPCASSQRVYCAAVAPAPNAPQNLPGCGGVLTREVSTQTCSGASAQCDQPPTVDRRPIEACGTSQLCIPDGASRGCIDCDGSCADPSLTCSGCLTPQVPVNCPLSSPCIRHDSFISSYGPNTFTTTVSPNNDGYRYYINPYHGGPRVQGPTSINPSFRLLKPESTFSNEIPVLRNQLGLKVDIFCQQGTLSYNTRSSTCRSTDFGLSMGQSCTTYLATSTAPVRVNLTEVRCPEQVDPANITIRVEVSDRNYTTSCPRELYETGMYKLKASF